MGCGVSPSSVTSTSMNPAASEIERRRWSEFAGVACFIEAATDGSSAPSSSSWFAMYGLFPGVAHTVANSAPPSRSTRTASFRPQWARQELDTLLTDDVGGNVASANGSSSAGAANRSTPSPTAVRATSIIAGLTSTPTTRPRGATSGAPCRVTGPVHRRGPGARRRFPSRRCAPRVAPTRPRHPSTTRRPRPAVVRAENPMPSCPFRSARNTTLRRRGQRLALLVGVDSARSQSPPRVTVSAWRCAEPRASRLRSSARGRGRRPPWRRSCTPRGPRARRRPSTAAGTRNRPHRTRRLPERPAS